MSPKKSNHLLAFAFVLLLSPFMASNAYADTVDVNISGFAFVYNNITINAGTYVRWTNSDGAPHTSTSDSPYWDSGTLTTGQEYVFLFDTPGIYPYHCEIHPSMMATVNVNTATPVPSMNSYFSVLLILAMLISGYGIYRKKLTPAAN